MRVRPSRRPGFPTWLRHLLAGLVVVAQLAGMAGALSEGARGPDAVSHVDAAGTSRHYAHDEARCVTCQSLTVHATASRPPLPAVERVRHATVSGAEAWVAPSYYRATNNPSRAPPTLS